MLSRIPFRCAREGARRSLRPVAIGWVAAVSVACVGVANAGSGLGHPTLNARNPEVTDHDALTVTQVGGGITNTRSAPVRVRLDTLSPEDQSQIRKLLKTKGALPPPTRSDSTKYDITGEVDGETRTVRRVPEELVPFAVRSLVKPELPGR